MDVKEDITQDNANPKIHWQSIYAEHAKYALTKPYQVLFSVALNFPTSGVAVLPLSLIYTLLLPVTLTLGVGISTKIAVDARKPLLKDELNSLLQDISQLNETIDVENVNALEKNIMEYRAKSQKSEQLKEDLMELRIIEKSMIQEVEKKIFDKYRFIKIDELKKSVGDFKEQAFFTINYDAVEKSLSSPKIQEELSVAIQPIIKERCQNQLRKIYFYLSDPENTGTRMQRIILETMMKFKEAERIYSLNTPGG